MSHQRFYRRNLALFVGVEVGWSVGYALVEFRTIVPALLSSLGATATAVGLVPCLHYLGYSLPQLASGYFTGHLRRKLPATILWHNLAALPLLVYGGYLLLLPEGTHEQRLIAVPFYGTWALFVGITAFCIPLYYNFLGRILGPKDRGSSFGLIYTIHNLAMIPAAFAARELIRLPFPAGFGWCFLGAGVAIVIGNAFFLPVREPEGPADERTTPAEYFSACLQALREDLALRNYVLSRILTSFSSVVVFFYTAYALKGNVFAADEAGDLTVALVVGLCVGSAALGPLADRIGFRVVAVLGWFLLLAVVPVLILGEDRWTFMAASFLVGCSASAEQVTYVNLVLDLSPGRDATTYLGLVGSAIAPFAVLVPLIGGICIDRIGFPAVAIAASVFVLAGALVLLRRVNP